MATGVQRRFFRFLLWLSSAGALMTTLGVYPTTHLGGPAAAQAMLAGCGVSFFASILGGILLLALAQGPTTTIAAAGLVATGLRFGVALLGGTLVALGTTLDRVPLLIWVALSHLIFLTIDVRFAFQMIADSEAT